MQYQFREALALVDSEKPGVEIQNALARLFGNRFLGFSCECIACSMRQIPFVSMTEKKAMDKLVDETDLGSVYTFQFAPFNFLPYNSSNPHKALDRLEKLAEKYKLKQQGIALSVNGDKKFSEEDDSFAGLLAKYGNDKHYLTLILGSKRFSVWLAEDGTEFRISSKIHRTAKSGDESLNLQELLKIKFVYDDLFYKIIPRKETDTLLDRIHKGLVIRPNQ